MPFLTEAVYQQLVRPVDTTAPASIHWVDFPQVDSALIDEELESRMDVVRAAVALGRKLREDHRIKIRQPLPTLTVVHRDPAVRAAAEAGAAAIAAELNIKSVLVESDESAFCTITVKPNFATLRQRCPAKIKQIAPALREWALPRSLPWKRVEPSRSQTKRLVLRMCSWNASRLATLPLRLMVS